MKSSWLPYIKYLQCYAAEQMKAPDVYSIEIDSISSIYLFIHLYLYVFMPKKKQRKKERKNGNREKRKISFIFLHFRVHSTYEVINGRNFKLQWISFLLLHYFVDTFSASFFFFFFWRGLDLFRFHATLSIFSNFFVIFSLLLCVLVCCCSGLPFLFVQPYLFHHYIRRLLHNKI